MKIGINGFEAIIPRFGYDANGLPNRVGSSEVCFELLLELSKIDKTNDYLIYLPASPTPDMPEESANWHYKIIPHRKAWTISGLTLELLKRPKLDVFFSPTHYGPLFTPCPEVISILDVSYKYFPELFNKKDRLQLATWGKYTLKKAAKIITISHSSKDDIIKEYKVKADKISVVHLGIKAENRDQSEEKINMEDLRKKYGISSKYILFVGTLQPRKNVVRLIEAFRFLAEKNKSLELVIIGRKGWMYEEILGAPEKLGIAGKVRFLDSISDRELPMFYKHAEVFVLPSLYEGFGLPVLEAMKYGCPVATSDISSLPEAGGDAAIYFDPKSVVDMVEKIDKVLNSDSLRQKMIKQGYEQVKKFSWEKAAREVLQVFEEVGVKSS